MSEVMNSRGTPVTLELVRAASWPQKSAHTPEPALVRSMTDDCLQSPGKTGTRIDRRSLRTELARLRAKQFGISEPTNSTKRSRALRNVPLDAGQVGPVLLGYSLVYLMPEAIALQERRAMPDLPKKLAAWNAGSMETSSAIDGGILAKLSSMQAKLSSLEGSVRSLRSVPVLASEGVSKFAQDLQEINEELVSFSPDSLARDARRLHNDLLTRCAELGAFMNNLAPVEGKASIEGMWSGGSIVGTTISWNNGTRSTITKITPTEFTVTLGEEEVLTAVLKDDGTLHWSDEDVWEKQSGAESKQDEEVVCRDIKLSQEQDVAIECDRSVFIQGRSGTGKTLVLIRRMIRQRSHELNGCREALQLYVTKSSLLRDEVASELDALGCTCATADWPSCGGARCLTWEQLVHTFEGESAVIGFDRFLKTYWPRLSAYARQLSPLLVWAEFNTRLRPFKCVWSLEEEGLRLAEYLQDDLAAVGVRLDNGDQHAIHWMFRTYTRMKKAVKEYDDVDVALTLLREINIRKQRYKTWRDYCKAISVYIDEAQDFSPAELVAIMSLCSDSSKLTVAGDTCQTINPGSAFNFNDIVDAFCVLHKQRPANPPQKLTLSLNYRCTPGIAALAGSVTHILFQRFPGCADRIEEDTQGLRSAIPVFIEWPGQSPSCLITGNGSKRLGSIDEARIVVLVRSGHEREELQKHGLRGTILTVAEAKGLEFDFVIICGFLSGLPDEIVCALADDTSRESELVVSFGSRSCKRLAGTAHELLCRVIMAIPELKTLYVALTRARQGCAIVECGSVPKNWELLLNSWQSQGLIELWKDAQGYACGLGLDNRQAVPDVLDESSNSELAKDHMIEWIQAEIRERAQKMRRAPRKQKEKNARDVNKLKEELSRLQSGGCVDECFGQCRSAKDAQAAKDWISLHGIESSSKQGMLSWLQSQLTALTSSDKEAKGLLKSELRRLEFQGNVDETFCERFAIFLHANRLAKEEDDDITVSSGNVMGQGQLLHVPRPVRMTPGLQSAELPSFVPSLRQRFGVVQETSAPIKDLMSRGQRLITHAVDNPRERWQLFASARQSFVQGFAVIRTVLAQQVEQAGRTSMPEESERSDIAWYQQLLIILEEVCSNRSWRSSCSSLRILDKLAAWSHIFTFLCPEGCDVWNLIWIVIERAFEHAVTRQELMTEAVKSKAYWLLEGARYDADLLAKEDTCEHGVLSMVQEAGAKHVAAEQAEKNVTFHFQNVHKSMERTLVFVKRVIGEADEEAIPPIISIGGAKATSAINGTYDLKGPFNDRPSWEKRNDKLWLVWLSGHWYITDFKKTKKDVEGFARTIEDVALPIFAESWEELSNATEPKWGRQSIVVSEAGQKKQIWRTVGIAFDMLGRPLESRLSYKPREGPTNVHQAAQWAGEATKKIASIIKPLKKEAKTVEKEAVEQAESLLTEAVDEAAAAINALELAGNHWSSKDQLMERAAHAVVKLWPLLTNRIERCAEAGRAFLYIRRPSLAAEAYWEACLVCRRLLELKFRQLPELVEVPASCWSSLWSTLVRDESVSQTRQEARSSLQLHSLHAARCSLLAAGCDSYGRVEDSDESHLRRAAMYFRCGGCIPPALACVARDGKGRALALQLLYVQWCSSAASGWRRWAPKMS